MPRPREGHTHIGGHLTDHAADGWWSWAEETGVDITALLEVMGRRLAEGRGHRPAMADIADEARKVMIQRRSRRRREPGADAR